MALKAVLGLLFAASLASAHPGGHEAIHQHAARPLKGRDLNHCSKRFGEPEFNKRFVEKNGDEFLRLRRSLGVEEHDRYVSRADSCQRVSRSRFVLFLWDGGTASEREG